jgi:hypothetical protein
MTMTRKEKIEWLSRYRNSLSRKSRIYDELRELQESISPKSPKFDGMPRGGNSNTSTVELHTVLLSLLQDEYKKSEEESQKIRSEIVSSLSRLKNENEYEVLKARYLSKQQKKFLEISFALELSESRVRHIHLDGLDHLEVPEQRDEILYGSNETTV